MHQNHRAQKKWGQNFLIDDRIIHNIIAELGGIDSDHLVEIGPGKGAISQLLLAKCNQLDIIEIDPHLIQLLQQKLGANPKLNIYHSDVLKFDFTCLSSTNSTKDKDLNKLANTPTKSLRIVGNLPYNIGSQIIMHLTKFKPLIADMLFMLQKEVVESLVAMPATSSYGRLSIMAQYHYSTQKLFDISPSSFYPIPKVISSMVQLSPHQNASVANNEQQFADIVAAAFNQRRKTISNSLKKILTLTDFESLAISPKLRAEELAVADYIKISKYLN